MGPCKVRKADETGRPGRRREYLYQGELAVRTWKLYTSGICCARVVQREGELLCALLDPATAEFSPLRPMTAADAARCRTVAGFDLPLLLGRLPEYDRLLTSGEPEVRTTAGERFCSADGRYYCQRDVKWPNNALVEDGRVVAFLRPSRERIHILAEEGYEDRTVLRQWSALFPEPILPIRTMENLRVPMRDGVELSASVLLPAGEGPFPTVLVRTPYGKEGELANYERYAHRGYAVVIQDVRGRSASGGEWRPNSCETEDGDDTIRWIAAQPWSDGAVGMMGGSYLGYVQWAAAASGNPHLKALVSVVCAGSPFGDLPRRGGCLSSGSMAWNFGVSRREWSPQLMERDDWDAVLDVRPLEEIPRRALGYDIPFFTEELAHPDLDAYWARGDWRTRGEGVTDVPALIVSGWFDDNGMGTTEALDLTARYPAGRRKIILGPWQHSGNSRYDLHSLHLGGEALRFDIDLIFLRWLDHWLKGRENGAEQLPCVEYYTLGEECWKTADNWPLPDSEPWVRYLTSGGGANTSDGDGLLTAEPPAEGEDGYCYDPRNPARHIIDVSENELAVPEDYTEEEHRPDLLCYTTPPLTEPVTLTGDFTVVLYVSSDCPDTDFVVRICDVDEGGRSVRLADGVLSARYRDGFDRARMMEPGERYCLRIRTTKVSNCFLPGHRIRLTVTSGAKNLVFPNSNTEAGFNSTVTRVAHNRVHHGGVYLSRVEGRQERGTAPGGEEQEEKP